MMQRKSPTGGTAGLRVKESSYETLNTRNFSTNHALEQDNRLPHSVEAEEALLGSILIDSAYVFYDIANLSITGADFFIERNGWIFDAALALHQAGKAVDQVTISDVLKGRSQLVEMGGPAYLSKLLTDTPTHIHGAHYARIVKEHAYRRQRIKAGTRIVQAYYDEQADLDSTESRVEKIWRSSQDSYISPSSQWEIFTLAHAYKPRPAMQWVVEGLFPLPSLSIVYGAPGTMKSLLLNDMLACVSSGNDWLPPLPGQNLRPRRTVESPVLWLDFDNGQRLTDERFEAFGRALNLPESTPLHYASMPNPWLDSSDYAHIEALARRIVGLGAKVVVIDNLGTVSGGVDENSAEMIKVMSNLRRLADTTGAAVILIHHQRKGNGFKGRSGDTLRGHSSIEAALDLALLVERDEGADRINLKSTKARNFDVSPFQAQFTYEHKLDTAELSEARFFGLEPEKDDSLITLQVVIMDCVKVNPGLSQNRLIEGVKKKLPDIGKHKIREGILSMVNEGKLKGQGGENGKALAYHLNDNYVEF